MEGRSANGYGTYTYANGSKYAGEWESGDKCGIGTYYASNGTKYFGEWKDDVMHGNGTLTRPNGTLIHSGEWVNGKPKENEPKNVS